MKNLVRFSTTLFAFFLLVTAEAQKKTPLKEKESTKEKTATQAPKDTTDIPPDISQLEDTRIEVPTAPPINFDTTAVVEDALTKSILRLLSITNAFETDVKVVEQSLKQSLAADNSTESTKFYERFMFEMREGRARRWLRNLYIRSYRSQFTQSEIEELINFYNTPIGKKLVQKQPLIMIQVMTEAQKIGAYMGATVMNEVMADNKQ